MFIRIFQFLALSVVIVLVTGGLILAIWPEMASITYKSIKAMSNFQVAKEKSPPRATSPLPARPPKTKKSSKPIIVDSYDALAHHPLSQWALKTVTAGHIDIIKQPANDEAQKSAALPSIIALSGWAGHSSLGMRFGHIIFSMCDKVVGSTPIDTNRPDVAKNVHVNLLRSGWSSRLNVSHLPTCANATLRAWGLAPKGKILWPLNGKVVVNKKHREDKIPVNIQANKTPLHPSRANIPRLQKIKIKPKRANLRRCASTSCKIVGKIKGGTHNGYIVEMYDQWALIQLNTGAGWMARRLFSVSSAK